MSLADPKESPPNEGLTPVVRGTAFFEALFIRALPLESLCRALFIRALLLKNLFGALFLHALLLENLFGALFLHALLLESLLGRLFSRALLLESLFGALFFHALSFGLLRGAKHHAVRLILADVIASPVVERTQLVPKVYQRHDVNKSPNGPRKKSLEENLARQICHRLITPDDRHSSFIDVT